MMQWLVHPLCLFLLVWGGAATLYLAGVCEGIFPSPGLLMVGSVLLNVVTFTLGYLTWTMFRGFDPAPAELAEVSGRPLTPRAAERALRLTFAMGMVAVVLEAYRIVLMARYFETTWFDLVTHPELFRIRLVTFIGANLFRTSGTVMLLSITNSLFSIGFVLLGVFLHLDRTIRKYFYLVAFLGISLTIGVIHLSRYEVTSNILYLVLAYCWMASLGRSEGRISDPKSRISDRWSSRFKLIVPLAAIVLLFAVIDVLLHKSGGFAQPTWLQGWLLHFYWYVASPLAAFNEFTTTFTGDLQWGQNSFFPLYKWLCRLHLVQETEVSIYGEFVFIPYVANVYTYLRNFYEDFGILGVAVIPYLLGWAVAAIRRRARLCLQYLNLYLVLLLFILFSFYNYFLISNQIYLQILFGFLFFRYRFEKPGPRTT